MIEEEIDVGVFPIFAAGNGTEHVQAFHPKPSELGLVFVEAADRVFAGHEFSIP
jgi:hypothetical protein